MQTAVFTCSQVEPLEPVATPQRQLTCAGMTFTHTHTRGQVQLVTQDVPAVCPVLINYYCVLGDTGLQSCVHV